MKTNHNKTNAYSTLAIEVLFCSIWFLLQFELIWFCFDLIRFKSFWNNTQLIKMLIEFLFFPNDSVLVCLFFLKKKLRLFWVSRYSFHFVHSFGIFFFIFYIFHWNNVNGNRTFAKKEFSWPMFSQCTKSDTNRLLKRFKWTRCALAQISKACVCADLLRNESLWVLYLEPM